jgi:hypothetical protein
MSAQARTDATSRAESAQPIRHTQSRACSSHPSQCSANRSTRRKCARKLTCHCATREHVLCSLTQGSLGYAQRQSNVHGYWTDHHSHAPTHAPLSHSATAGVVGSAPGSEAFVGRATRYSPSISASAISLLSVSPCIHTDHVWPRRPHVQWHTHHTDTTRGTGEIRDRAFHLEWLRL